MKEIVKDILCIGNREDGFTCLTQDTEITHILTIDAEPLARTQEFRKGNHDIIIKHIQCLDQLEADILSHLDECIRFIERGIENGRVLVHWYLHNFI